MKERVALEETGCRRPGSCSSWPFMRNGVVQEVMDEASGDHITQSEGLVNQSGSPQAPVQIG